MDTSSTRELSFGRTTDIQLPISFRLARLEGEIPRKTFRELEQRPEWQHLGTQQPCVVPARSQMRAKPARQLRGRKADSLPLPFCLQRPVGPLRDGRPVVRGPPSVDDAAHAAQVVRQVVHVGPPLPCRLLARPATCAHGLNRRPSSRATSWNEFLTIPVKYSSLLPTAQLTFTVFDCVGAGKPTPVGGSTMRLFEQPGFGPLSASLPGRAGRC